MNYYIRNFKFLVVYILLISVMSPIFIVGIGMDKFAWYDLISITLIILAVPLTMASLLYEIFVMDAIEEQDIISEINNFPRVKYLMIFFFVFTYIITFTLILFGESYASLSTMYLFLILPMIQQRIILTKDRIYCRLFHMNLDEIEHVVCTNTNTFRVITKSGKKVNFAIKDAQKVFKHLMNE